MRSLRDFAGGRPLTVLGIVYGLGVIVALAAGVKPSGHNIQRFAIAGFLLLFAVLVFVVFVHYLTVVRRSSIEGKRPRGLLPRHVIAVTGASTLTISWVCIELWARTLGDHYAPSFALPHAAVAALLWGIALSDVMRFERFRVTETGGVDLRDEPLRRRSSDNGDRRATDAN